MWWSLALVLLAAAPRLWGADPLEAVFKEAVQALGKGDLEAAERGFQRVLTARPSHLGALGNLGVVYYRRDRVADAIGVYRRALKLAPNEPGLLLNLGLAHLKLEDYVAAKPLFAKLPPTPQTTELLATCRLFTGEVDRALASLEKLPRTTGVLYLLGAGYLKMKNRARAQSAFQELLRTAARPAQAHYLLGKAYYQATLFDEADAAFRKALDLEPALPGLRLELGKTLISRRDHPGAEAELRAALTENPHDTGAAYYLGALLVLESRVEEAIPLLERARAARPEGWGAYYYLGRARLHTGQPASAIPLLEKAVHLNPNESSIYYQLARAYQAAGQAADAKRAQARFSKLRRGAAEKAQDAVVGRQP